MPNFGTSCSGVRAASARLYLLLLGLSADMKPNNGNHKENQHKHISVPGGFINYADS